MNDTERNFANDERGAAKGDGQVTGKVDSVARRRALLKGMSSGAALAAASVPLQSLAGGARKHAFDKRDFEKKKKQATVSGCHSAIKSADTNTEEAQGDHCTWYKDLTNWPKIRNEWGLYVHGCKGAGGTGFTKDAKFNQVFDCTDGPDKKISEICGTGGQTPGPEPFLNWVTACLNANVHGAKYPYTPAEVCAFYKSSKRDAAAEFFLNFMQGGRRA